MNSSSNLSFLIEKFHNGSISKMEMDELYLLINNSGSNSEREAAIQLLWENSAQFAGESNGAGIWKKIESQLDHKPQFIKKKNKVLLLSIQMGKYAAIIFLTFTISWLSFKYYNIANYAKNEITEYSVPLGSKSSLKLPDGTRVWLNSGSRLVYNSNFSKTDRTVYLEGEAYFDVTHNTKNPFFVKTSDLSIRVYGTKFNVKSFNDEKNVETTLVQGSITIQKLNKKGIAMQTIKMEPNQMVNYCKHEGKLEFINVIEKSGIHSVDISKQKPMEDINPIMAQKVEIATAWKDNRLSFKGQDIESLINNLQRWYGVEITLKNDRLKEAKFTGSFDKETIEQALDALKITIPFNYKMIKNQIIIY